MESVPGTNLPDFSSDNPRVLWDRFCEFLWFHEDLGIWLDISRMNVSSAEINSLLPNLETALVAMDSLESGAIANKDENRQVGHYWLRKPALSPKQEISTLISSEIEQIRQFSQEINNGTIKTSSNSTFTNVLWIGIGGSGLGPLLLINSLQEFGKGLNFYFLDNVDPVGISQKLELIGPDILNTLVVTVSKSGSTPEPRLAMLEARKFLESHQGDWPSQAVAITMKDSKLDKKAKDEKWLMRFDLPDWVGGRTSITSSVGLLPAALIGCDINKFLEGASLMDEATRNKDIFNNPAVLLAISWYFAGEGKGLRDMVVLPYRDRLELFSRYLQQLVMESLGKRVDRKGVETNQGIAVYGNKGSTDQHAYIQQLRDGLDNFFATFIEVLEDENELPNSDNEKLGDFLSGFLQGTRKALTEGGRQSVTITTKYFNERILGALIALFERTVGIYAELININAYHQPGVEAGKAAAAEVLVLQGEIQKLLSDGIQRSIKDISDCLNNDSNESIFLILRHLSHNDSSINVKGNWAEPKTLLFNK